jgi:hypothetical protein
VTVTPSTPPAPHILPTGETLPQYDSPPETGGADIWQLYRWCVENAGWPATGAAGYGLVADVIRALQTAGDATLVKNGTYRLMRRDGADVERLAAWLSNRGHADAIVGVGGNPVTAAITVIRDRQAQLGAG